MKTILTLVLAGALAVGIWMWATGSEHLPANQYGNRNADSEQPSSLSLEEDDRQGSTRAGQEQVERPPIEMRRSPTDFSTHPNGSWMLDRGFTNESNIHFSDDEYLEEQAENGDMLATQLLGYKRLATPEGDQLLRRAAVLGSIQALHFLSASSQFKIDRMSNDLTIEQLQQETLSALKYLLVAELRGDLMAAPNDIRGLKNKYGYTKEELATVCELAQSEFSMLNQERMQAGHAEFDNSPPPNVSVPPAFTEICGSTP